MGARESRAYRGYLLAGAAVCSVYVFLGSAAQNVLYDLTAVSAAAALLIGPRRLGVAHRLPWTLMAFGLLAFATGDMVFTYDEMIRNAQTPFPSIADALYLAGYPLIAAGTVAIVRRRAPGRDRGSLIDASVIALGAGVLTWVYVAAPFTRDSSLTGAGMAVSIGYPLMDLLVLAVMVRLVVGGGSRNTSFRFLCLAVGALLSADILYASDLFGGGYVSGGPVDLLWLVSYVTWGTAALHPSAHRLSEAVPVGEERLTRRRLAALAVAATVSPAIALIDAIRGANTNVAVVSVAAVALFMLVLLRLAGLNKVLQNTAEELRIQGAELSTTVDELRSSERERGRLLDRVMRIADEEREGREIAEQARVSLENLRERQVRFATMAAHEIRTPVTALLGSLWTLERIGSSTNEEERDLLSASVRQARRLARLCEDLLVVSEVTRDTLFVAPEDVEVPTVVKEVVDDIGGTAEDRVRLTLSSDVRVVTDPYRLGQILTNLIRNALQYSPEENPVDVSARTLSGGGVELVVSDFGPGIPEKDRPGLFERFGDRPAGASGGLGVGLWIVHRLVVSMNGDIVVGTNPHGGAMFTVRLPARPEQPALHMRVS